MEQWGRGERKKGNASEGREKAAPLPRQSYTEEAGRADIILGKLTWSEHVVVAE